MKVRIRHYQPRTNRRGQGVVEFLFVSLSFITVFYLLIRMSLGFGVSSFIQYATFVSARTLLPSRSQESQQQAEARTILNQFLGDDASRFRSVVRSAEIETVGRGPQNTGSDPDMVWQEGISFRFTMTPFAKAFIPLPRPTGLELVSESWLGREVSVKDCSDYMSGAGPDARGASHPWLFDNGC